MENAGFFTFFSDIAGLGHKTNKNSPHVVVFARRRIANFA